MFAQFNIFKKLSKNLKEEIESMKDERADLAREKRTIQYDLDHAKKVNSDELFRLRREIVNQKSDQDADHIRKVNLLKEDNETLVKNMKKEAAIDKTEIEGLLKVEQAQAIAQLDLNHKSEISELKSSQAKAVSDIQATESKKVYDLLQTELASMNKEGNVTTKLAEKMLFTFMDKQGKLGLNKTVLEANVITSNGKPAE